jgi:hypothetical protein
MFDGSLQKFIETENTSMNKKTEQMKFWYLSVDIQNQENLSCQTCIL